MRQLDSAERDGCISIRLTDLRAILFEVSIARTRPGYEDCRGLITREGEVGRVSGFGIERALHKHAGMSVVGLFAISKVPFTRDNHCKPIVAVGMRRDMSMCRYLGKNSARASFWSD